MFKLRLGTIRRHEPKIPQNSTETKYKIMDKFTTTELRMLRLEIEASLKEMCAKHGISPKIGSMRFDAHTCKVTLELKLDGASEVESEYEKKSFEIFASSFGLQATDFGKTFRQGNAVFTITGINPNRPKFPVSGVRSDGKSFKFPAYAVKMALGR